MGETPLANGQTYSRNSPTTQRQHPTTTVSELTAICQGSVGAGNMRNEQTQTTAIRPSETIDNHSHSEVTVICLGSVGADDMRTEQNIW